MENTSENQGEEKYLYGFNVNETKMTLGNGSKFAADFYIVIL